jgi:succinyl-CoA synthetase alpha subunit
MYHIGIKMKSEQDSCKMIVLLSHIAHKKEEEKEHMVEAHSIKPTKYTTKYSFNFIIDVYT